MDACFIQCIETSNLLDTIDSIFLNAGVEHTIPLKSNC